MTMSADAIPNLVVVSSFSKLLDVKPRALRVPALASELELPETSVVKGPDCPGWSPATFRGTRKAANVERVSFLVFDFDAGEPPWERFEGLDYFATTTHSHTPDHPRWRLVLSLSAPIETADWGRHLFDAWGLADRSWEGAKDCSRFFYLPPKGCEVRRNKGAPWVPPAKPSTKSAPRRAAPAPAPAPAQSASRWAMAALDDACRTMRAAPESTRHDVWYAQHAAMAELVAGGELSSGIVFAALEQAGREAFGADWEKRWADDLPRTRQDAFDKGLQNPRRAPESNVRRGPWVATRAPVQPEPEPEFDDTSADEVEDEDRPIPLPQARVPYTDKRYVPLPATAPLAGVVPYLNRGGHEHLDDHSVAGYIIRACERLGTPLYYSGEVGESGPLHVYRGGAYREVDPYALASECCGRLHGALTIGIAQQVKRAQEEGDKARAKALAGRHYYTASITDKRAVAQQLRDQLGGARKMAGDEAGMFADAPPGAVFTNGTIVKRGDRFVFEAHSPDHRQRHAFGFDYVPGLVPAHTQQVMRDWFRDCDEAEREARIRALRAAGGIALLGAYESVRRSIWLYGKSGHDGKGTYQAILSALMPRGSVVRCSPADGSNRATGGDALARLASARLNIVEEAGDQLASLEKLKQALACEPINVRRVGGSHYEITSRCIWVLASNELPRIPPANDTSWERRILPIKFSAPIPAHMVDRELVAKLLGHEAQAIACWFIDAALEMLERGGNYTLPACAVEVFNEWRQVSADHLERFISGLTAMGPAPSQREFRPLADLLNDYAEDLAARRVKAEVPTLAEFGKRVKVVLADRGKVVKQGGCSRYWIWSDADASAPATPGSPPPVATLSLDEQRALVAKLPPTVKSVWAGGVWLQNPGYREPEAPPPAPKTAHEQSHELVDDFVTDAGTAPDDRSMFGNS